MRIFAVAVLIALGIVVSSAAGDDTGSLKGLRSVAVRFEGSLFLKNSPLIPTQAELATEVELRLRKAGLPVRGDNVDAVVLVTVDAFQRTSDAAWAFHIVIEVQQGVRLVRSGAESKIFYATTWSTWSYGTVGSDNLKTSLRNTLGNYTDEFLNAYLAANQ